jgi:hypothetical protein
MTTENEKYIHLVWRSSSRMRAEIEKCCVSLAEGSAVASRCQFLFFS